VSRPLIIGIGCSVSLAVALSNVLLLASVAGRMEVLVPFTRIVEAPYPALAVAGIAVDGLFYVGLIALVSALFKAGSLNRAALVFGLAYGSLGAMGAAWLAVSWISDFAGSAQVTETVYSVIWNGVNAGLGAALWASVALDERCPLRIRLFSGVLSGLACVVGLGVWFLPAVADLLLPMLLVGLVAWPVGMAYSRPGHSPGRNWM